ncbi:MFS transporter [Kribbella hippodromi]|uniref:MFS transporter n=2 Tax=Kribbella hippodromi TaxID=434347 RepID=A0ABN2E392_9ACTN
MSATLGVSSGAAGQAVTVYAAGTALTAIPLTAMTASVRRKPLLLLAMTAFLIANTLTAAAPGYAVLLFARFLAGVAAGLAWAILAGYARRIAPAGLEGRAIAIAMTGIPLALSLGVPAGTLLGQRVGWQAAFAAVSILTIAVVMWIIRSVPPVDQPSVARPALDRPAVERLPIERSPIERPGIVGAGRSSARQTLKVPGVAAILLVVVAFVLGHTIIYAYIAPYLWHAGLGPSTDAVLLAFGLACLVSIWYVGRGIDQHLRTLALTGAALFTLSVAVMAATQAHPVVWIAAVVWGLGWGGMPTLLQTAAGQAGLRGGPAVADTAQAILVTLWNAAMALGGIIGGLILQDLGAATAATAAAILGAISLLIITATHRNAFPTTQTTP